VASVSSASSRVATSDGRKSGFDYMSSATQAMQREDDQNPALLWVAQGEASFTQQCTTCHQSASLADVATRYPAYDRKSKSAVTLTARINLCRTRHLKQAAYPPEHEEWLALASYLGFLAREKPIRAATDKRLRPTLAMGQKLYHQPMGQLAMSCAMCHDRLAGKRLAGSAIPQAHPTAYPIYRLEWQAIGSLERRLRGCLTGVRALPFTSGGHEYTALELYLMNRAAGMVVETPGVRP
jgi:sulfur-oxidizing protein SoxA